MGLALCTSSCGVYFCNKKKEGPFCMNIRGNAVACTLATLPSGYGFDFILKNELKYQPLAQSTKPKLATRERCLKAKATGIFSSLIEC